MTSHALSQTSNDTPAGPVTSEAVLRVEDLRTYFHTDEGVVKAADGVTFDVTRGRTTCLVGESGCGKSITARSIAGLVLPPGRIERGHAWFQPDTDADPVDLAALDPTGEQIRSIRGGDIGFVFQEPGASLSPMYTIGTQLARAIRLHQPISKAEAKEQAIEHLARVGIPSPHTRFDAYPFQLSGGMNQRAMIAIALANDPALLIADEPTTALDVTTQARILDLLANLQEETGMSMLFITHDLGVVAEIADDVSVMYLGTVAERGSVTDIFDRPQHPYTQALLESIPTITTDGTSEETSEETSDGAGDGGRLPAIPGNVPHPNQRPTGCPFHTRCQFAMPGLCDETTPHPIALDDGRLVRCHLRDPDIENLPPQVVTEPDSAESPAPAPTASPAPHEAQPSVDEGEPIMSIRDLQVHFPIKSGFFGRTTGHVHAVDGVDLTIHRGETLGLVGESGCGKTTLGRTIVRALDPTAGTITYQGDTSEVDLTSLDNRALTPYRGQIRMIFQDPFTSVNPRKTLLQIIGEPLRRLGDGQPPGAIADQVGHMLTRVGLRPEYMHRYPHAFSGGERQRVNIARALITRPRLVVADEAVSALDVSVRAQILNLLADLQQEYNLTYLFISHDLSVVEHLCDRVAVMYLGKVVEQAPTRELFTTPRHPYTEALLSAVPVPDPHRRDQRRIRLNDELPDPTNPPAGCPFHTRCPHRRDERCDDERPTLELLEPAHRTSCHYPLTPNQDGPPTRTQTGTTEQDTHA
ncbi:ABC transporter ATP-binding protein [Ruania alkalisoli]|nr:ABC transporter ATP-binding protein [Ruania alkalisoli]